MNCLTGRANITLKDISIEYQKKYDILKIFVFCATSVYPFNCYDRHVYFNSQVLAK